MKAYLVTQPNENPRMGDLLVDLLTANGPGLIRLHAAVAFAKRSGVRHLAEHLAEFLKNGGTARVVVGVDQRVTTAEGLQALLDVIGDRGEVWVFHNANPAATFHPKLYVMEGPDRAVLAVGSSNLTEGGLFTNYETSLVTELDLSIAQDKELLDTAKKYVDSLCNANSGLAIRITGETIQKLLEQGMVLSESEVAKASRETPPQPEAERGSESRSGSFFRALSVAPPPPIKLPRATLAGKSQRPAGSVVFAALRRGPLVWRKKLAASDVHRQPGHATGGVRLTQAGWKVRGRKINQTRYFRNTVFGGANWIVRRQAPKVEAASVQVEVTVLGKNLGVHSLAVSHKPSGEAGQGNYTSLLHWGDLGAQIKTANLAGRTLTLYAPAEGASGPYFVDIS